MNTPLPRNIVQARITLMLDQPYLASAIARLPLIDATHYDWCPTLATDGYNIFFNSSFLEDLSSDEISFLIAHEVMHCVLGHIDRQEARKHELWNLAIDYATNLMLVDFGMTMPSEGLYNKSYCGMSAEDVYTKLSHIHKPSTYGKKNALVISLQPSSNSSPRPGRFDIHLRADDVRGETYRSQDNPTIEERKRLRIQLSKELISKIRGTQRGYYSEELQKASKTSIPWPVLLARFFTGLRRDDYRMWPANKKHIHRGLYLPSVGVPGPNHLVVAIDTSGSMNTEELSRIIAEIDKLRMVTQCDLTLIQCDAVIQKVNEYDAYNDVNFNKIRILGRGGTRFEPVFEWVKDKQQSGGLFFDALIYLTDGDGSFPEKAPSYPVLWIMTTRNCSLAPFGQTIIM